MGRVGVVWTSEDNGYDDERGWGWGRGPALARNVLYKWCEFCRATVDVSE